MPAQLQKPGLRGICGGVDANNTCRVYALLRQELWGDAIKKFQRISYVHSRMTTAPAKAKI
jgi:hypothetical protein